MKLRVRLNKQTKVVSLDDTNCTLASLRKAVKNEFGISGCRLSLNRESELTGDDGLLIDLGIVSGDLVHILSDQANLPPSNPQPSTVHVSASKTQTPTAKTEPPKPERVKHSDTEAPSSSDTPMDTGGSVDPEPIQDEAASRLLREPLLIGEATDKDGLPQCVVTAYAAAGVQNDKEAMCVLCHILMTEVGFYARSEDKGAAAADDAAPSDKYAFPAGWKIPGSYRFCYRYPQMEDVDFTLVLVPLGNQMMIHGSAEQGEHTHLSQMQVKPADFVQTVDLGPGGAYNIPVLKKFSHQFKDTIAYPMLHNTLSENAPVVPRLDCLVLELQIQILKHLDVKSLLTLSETCRRLNSASKERVIWRRMFLRDFGRRTDNDVAQDWRRIYKAGHQNRQNVRRLMQNRPMPGRIPPPFTTPHPDFPIAPTPPGFIVGGDYDRDPNFSGLIDPMGRGRFPGGMGPGGVGPGGYPNPLMPRPRFDPYGPLPDQQFRPGRGGGIWDETQPRGPGGGNRRRDPFGGGGGFGGFGGGFI